MFTAMGKLVKRAKQRGTWTDKIHKKYEAIDKEATQIVLTAEEQYVSKFRYTTP